MFLEQRSPSDDLVASWITLGPPSMMVIWPSWLVSSRAVRFRRVSLTLILYFRGTFPFGSVVIFSIKVFSLKHMLRHTMAPPSIMRLIACHLVDKRVMLLRCIRQHEIYRHVTWCDISGEGAASAVWWAYLRISTGL